MNDVRELHRLLFLVPAKDDEVDYALWLSFILRHWPTKQQAKLLFLLTNPLMSIQDNGRQIRVMYLLRYIIVMF